MIINGERSDFLSIYHGVIQYSGTVAIHITNLVKIYISVEFFLFSDDSEVFVKGWDWREVIMNASAGISNIKMARSKCAYSQCLKNLISSHFIAEY